MQYGARGATGHGRRAKSLDSSGQQCGGNRASAPHAERLVVEPDLDSGLGLGISASASAGAGESILNSGFEVIVGQVEAKRNVGVQDASRGADNGDNKPEPMQARR